MDFAYDDRTQELRERLLTFMAEQVYPAEFGGLLSEARTVAAMAIDPEVRAIN